MEHFFSNNWKKQKNLIGSPGTGGRRQQDTAMNDLEEQASRHPHSAKNENLVSKSSTKMFGSQVEKGARNVSEVSSSAAWLDNPPNAGGLMQA